MAWPRQVVRPVACEGGVLSDDRASRRGSATYSYQWIPPTSTPRKENAATWTWTGPDGTITISQTVTVVPPPQFVPVAWPVRHRCAVPGARVRRADAGRSGDLPSAPGVRGDGRGSDRRGVSGRRERDADRRGAHRHIPAPPPGTCSGPGQRPSGIRPPGTSGIERSRTPHARKIAFAIAGATAMIGASPPPADG